MLQSLKKAFFEASKSSNPDVNNEGVPPQNPTLMQVKPEDRQDRPPQETQSGDAESRPGVDHGQAQSPEDNTEPSPAQRNHARPRMPYIDSNRSLVIPFCSPAKYHYWNGGQSLTQTLQELNASEEVINRYKSIYNT